MNIKDIKIIIEKAKKEKLNILVVGDIMLDRYVSGDVNRISPEAPVPILNYNKEINRLGGAGNVASNLFNLNVRVDIFGFIGDDSQGIQIKELLKFENISSNFLHKTKKANTTIKTRFISNGIQILRLDNDSKGFCEKDYAELTKIIEKNLDNYDSIIISDYNKGVCNTNLIKNIISKANKKKIKIFIDPKGLHWEKYSNGTIVTPNTKEVEDLLNIKIRTNSEFKNAGKKIIEKYNFKACLITRGHQGMTYVEKNRCFHQKVGEKEVFDVSGAGDTVIASFATSICLGINVKNALKFSSFLSSEVVAYHGTTPFNLKMVNKYD